MTKILNEDYVPKKPCLAVVIPKEKLMQLIQETYDKNRDIEWDDPWDEDTDVFTWAPIVRSSALTDTIDFDMENCDDHFSSLAGLDQETKDLLGLTTLPNGVPIYGFMAGGDWEEPVYGCFYYNGHNIDLYVPIKGNAVNLDFHSAFGSENHGYFYGDDKEADEDESEKYIAKYGLTPEDDLINGKAMQEELLQVLDPKALEFKDAKQALLRMVDIIEISAKAKTVKDCKKALFEMSDVLDVVREFTNKETDPEFHGQCKKLLEVFGLYADLMKQLSEKNGKKDPDIEAIYSHIKETTDGLFLEDDDRSLI